MSKTSQAPPTKLSDEQVDRLLIVIKHLASRKNTVAELIQTAIDQNEAKEVKRKIIITSFALCWELLLSMNMAIDSTATPEALKLTLDAGGKKS